MNKYDNRIGSVIGWFVCAMIIIVLFFSCPTNQYQLSYYVLCVNLGIIGGIWVWRTSIRKMHIFEPIVLVSVIHVCLFEITPILCLFSNNILWYDVNIWDGCVKATWLSTLAYIMFIFAYFRKDYYPKREIQSIKSLINNGRGCLRKSYIIWLIGFISSVILIIAQGGNIIYLLTLGIGGTESDAQVASVVEFFGVIAFCMLPSYIYIYILGQSKLIKILLFYLMCVCFLIRGFRFILVAVIMAPIIVDSLLKNKKPSAMRIICVLLLILFMIGFVGAARDEIRSGVGISENILKVINGQYIFDMLVENFSIFKTFYGIVLKIPEEMSYTGGQLMIVYTLIMFIPRVLWPSKPLPVSQKINAVAVNSYASKAGTAYPYIGEYYHEFGIIGVAVFSYFLGVFCSKLKSLICSEDLHSIVLYSTVYPLLMQILIRGYTPSNFYLLLTCYIPVIVIKRFDKRNGKWKRL